MNNKILQKLLDKLERYFGDLDNEKGCYINGRWLSIENIVKLIKIIDKDY